VVPGARTHLRAGGRHTSGIRPNCKLNFENDFRAVRRRVLGRPRVGLDNACESKCALSLSHLNRWTVLGQCTLRRRKGVVPIGLNCYDVTGRIVAAIDLILSNSLPWVALC